MDVELVARTSFSSLQKVDDAFIVSPDNLGHENWTWSNLRKQFNNKGLEKLYSVYHRRLQNGYLSLFGLVQLILVTLHYVTLISSVGLEKCAADIVVAGIVNALIFPIIALSFRSELIDSRPYLPVIFSCLIVALLVSGDIAVPVYHTVTNTDENYSLRPTYATYGLLVCYFFLPLTNNLHVCILGLTATFCYLAHLYIDTYRNCTDYGIRLFSDTMYYVAVNGLGLYFRFMNEVMIRRSFLDRRKCVECTLRLNYEKDQEEQLTRSILPPHFAVKIRKDFRDIFKFIEEHKKPPPQRKNQKDLYVETHENVSILYADVVNFSGLTVALPVKKIVETLNELFGRFDEASERHNVLRIKFLGDCYYCVSGVPIPNPQHAKSCVDLGLDMISIIQEIRARVERECGVDVNMRIGVHSGNIISGILGSSKWQYDVWSRDVIIANKMEQTGEPGKVHVTRQTLELLPNITQYDYQSIDRSEDDILRDYGITQSYLISRSSNTYCSNCSSASSIKSQRTSIPSQKLYVRWCNSTTAGSTSMPPNQADVFASSFRRRTHFMDSCLRNYHLMLKAADVEMEKAIEQLPITKWQQWCRWDHINPLLLTFTPWNWEIPYLREPDPLFKFYILCATVLLLLMGLVLLVPSIYKYKWHVETSVSYGLALLFCLILIPVTWTHFIWNRFKDPYETEGNFHQPANRLLNFFYQTSIKVVWSMPLRTALYIIIMVMISMCGVFNLMLECKYEKPENDITSVVTDKNVKKMGCVLTAWQFTQTCSLAIIMSFLFLKVHYLLKFLVGILIMSFYIWNVYFYRSFIFVSSETWNPFLKSECAHVLTIVYLTCTLHLIDRQAEYLNRLDYQWKRQLKKEQDEAFHTRNANKLLLRNILPEHVADFYLNMNRTEENELYYEAHDNVAVMFASLTDLLIDESNTLASLNEIICQFDRLLYESKFAGKIEKIKLAGTTYMAACGLEISRRDSMQSYHGNFMPKYNPVKLLTEFAARMMSTLDKAQDGLRKTQKRYKLRIGISHGEVTAGVVGAQKPLYDIWGDAVNMASRMDTTGLAGKIQVTKETAKELIDEDIECQLRGETYVKPKGLVLTYFINLDDKNEIQMISDRRVSPPVPSCPTLEES